MEIKIRSIEITEFKGISSLTLNLNGNDATITGRNGTGKTSVYDAFCWCLFGRDSNGASDFDVKPVTKDGQRIRGTETSVSCVLDVDGKETVYTRILHEKWRTVPGSKEPTYMGDETICSIDGVPKKVNEYKAAVNMMIGDGDLFKLITIHGSFMDLPWEVRRRHLMTLAGGNPDAEIKSKPEFAGIDNILKGQSVDDAKKRIRSELKGYNDELNVIPSRIDEARKLSEGMTESEYRELDWKRKVVQDELSSVIDQLSGGVEAFRAADEKIKAQRELVERQNAIINSVNKRNADAKLQYEIALGNAMAAVEVTKREVERLEYETEQIDKEIGVFMKEREKLLKDWYDINDQEYVEPEYSHTCPYCGQELPMDKIAELRTNMANEYYTKRDTKLDEISASGKSIAQKIESLKMEQKNVGESLDRKKELLSTRVAEYKALSTNTVDEEDYTKNPEYVELQKQLDEMSATADDSVDVQREELKKRRSRLEADVAMYNEKMATYQQTLNAKNRIAELEERQAEVGAIVARLGGDLEILKKYTMAVCSAVEESINKLFHSVKWKLFRELKSDGIEPCCEATVDGVSYGRGLNNAACINVGIEIIKVLSDEYHIIAPTFVDNAEAVNNLAHTNGQMIKLVVSSYNELTLIVED